MVMKALAGKTETVFRANSNGMLTVKNVEHTKNSSTPKNVLLLKLIPKSLQLIRLISKPIRQLTGLNLAPDPESFTKRRI